MRVVTNESKLKRNRQTATILFFVSLGVLFSGLILNAMTAATDLFLLVPCIVMPVGLLTTVFSVRLTNEYIRTPHPEDVIETGLKGIDKRSILFNHLPPANHILVTPTCIYAMHALFHNRRFAVRKDRWIDSKRVGPLAPIFQYLKQENIGKPFQEAELAAARTQQIVDATLGEEKFDVLPVVVMVGPQVTLELENPQYPVVFGDARKKPSLKGLVREGKRDSTASLSDEQIMKLYDAFTMTAGTRAVLTDSGLDDEAEE